MGEAARLSYFHARHSLAAWIPDLGLTLSIVTLVYCLFMFDGWHALFRDSDTGWHIRTGEAILDSRTLPAIDPYSFSRPAATWLDWEWGADVLAAAAYRAGGLPGVAALFAVAIAACTWLWTRLHFSAGGTLLLACAMAGPMLSTANLHWLARPHVFGWVLLLACLLMLERRARTAWFLLLGIAWANLHGSFFLAPVIALFYAAGHLIRPYIWTTERTANPHWEAAFALAAGTLVNPYGWQLHFHVAQYLADNELLSRIGEFQSFNFHVEGAGQITLTLLIAAAGAIAALSQRRLEHFLTGLFFIALAMRSARALPIVALAVLPLANGAITEALRCARGLAPRFRRYVETVLDYSDRLRILDRSLSGLALVPVILLLTAIATRRASAGFPADQFPVEASAAVAALPADARILAPDKFGGYIIYHYGGKRKVFFDGRSDFYGAAFMKDYIRLVEVRPGWHDQLQRFAFTHALLPVNYSLVSALEQRGWQRVHRDATAILLAAPPAATKDR